jgi:hypothetical protein
MYGNLVLSIALRDECWYSAHLRDEETRNYFVPDHKDETAIRTYAIKSIICDLIVNRNFRKVGKLEEIESKL